MFNSMRLCVLLNVSLIFGFPIYNLVIFSFDFNHRYVQTNLNIIVFVVFFAYLIYKKSYNIVNFYFKFFTIAKLIILFQYFINQREQFMNYLCLQIFFFQMSQVPFPDRNVNINQINSIQEYNQIVQCKKLKNSHQFIFLYFRQLDKCKAGYYDFSRFIDDVYKHYKLSDNQIQFHQIDLSKQLQIRRLIQNQHGLKYEDFPLLLGYKNGQQTLMYPKRIDREEQHFKKDSLYQIIDIQSIVN